jgi:ubiquinone/menaquinone biosynthesis C-methylase UbiE
MKIRDSGMPEEPIWRDFFEPRSTLARLGMTPACVDVVEFGCGYGTFTIPAARIVSGTVHAVDIEPAMIETTRARAAEAGLANVALVLRDFMVEGTGLPDESTDYAMVFNILHPEDPVALLREACRVLRAGGLIGIMHWRCDRPTPRGPDLAFRPRPEDCRRWAEEAGFEPVGEGIVELQPFHHGMTLRR